MTCLVLYFGLLYLVDKSMFLNPLWQWASLLVYVFFMFRASSADAAIGKDFRKRVRAPFLVFVWMTLAYWFLFYGLHLADPELLRMETAMHIAQLKQQVEAGTGDPAQSARLREQLLYLEREGMSLGMGHVLVQLAFGMVGGFGLAAAVTAFRSSKS